MWHDGWHSLLWVWISASQKIPLSVLTRNQHNGLAREISNETGRERRKEGPREKRSGQDREMDRIGQSTEQKKPVDRTGPSAGESRRLLGPVDSDAGLANLRRWVSIPGDFVGISLEYTLADGRRAVQKCNKLLCSCAWS